MSDSFIVRIHRLTKGQYTHRYRFQKEDVKCLGLAEAKSKQKEIEDTLGPNDTTSLHVKRAGSRRYMAYPDAQAYAEAKEALDA